MKSKWLSGLTVLLFAGLFMAACPIDGINDNTGQKAPYYRDILPISDGWIAVGTLVRLFSNNEFTTNDGFIAKYDSQGKISWERTFGGSGLEEGYSVTEIADGYIVIALSDSNDGDLAGLKQDTQGRMTPVTVKFDKNGTLLWAKELNIWSSEPHKIIANDAGFLTVVGVKTSVKKLSDANGPLYVTQFDTDGNVIWENPIGDNLELYGEKNNTLSISKIFAGPDGYFLLGQAIHFYDVPYYGEYSSGPCFIVSIDEDGTFRWQKAFESSYYYIASMIIADNSIVVAGGTVQDGAFIEKLDFAMNSVWKASYQKFNYGYYGLSDMTEIDGNIFTVGDGSVINEGHIFGIDTNGEVFWESELQGEKDEDHTQYLNILRQGEDLVVYRYAQIYGKGKIPIPSNSFLFFTPPRND